MTTIKKLSSIIFIFIVASLISFILERSLILTTILSVSEYSYNEILSLYYMGFRFDLKVIFTFLLIFYLPYLFILLMIFKNHKKIIIGFNYVLFLILVFFIIMGFVNYGFYNFLGNHIDRMIFGLVDDGFMAVFDAMLFNTEIVFLVFVLGAFIILVYIIFSRQDKSFEIINSSIVSLVSAFVFCLIMVYIFAPGGGSGKFSLSRTTNKSNIDVAINELAINSVMYLYYANKDKKSSTLDISSKKILQDINISNLDKLKAIAGYNKNNPLIKQTSQKNHNMPNIIFILMESFTSHINLKHNDKTNNILGEFNKHKNEDYFNNLIFSNESYTNTALERILLNSPIHHLSVSEGKNIAFKTSNIAVLKKAGYDTEFIYGGHRTWRLIGDFYLKQGFDRFYGRSNIELFAKRQSNHYWGAYDEDTFKFLKHRLKRTHNKPFFSFILSTTNHDDVVLPDDFKSRKFDFSQYDKKATPQNQKMLDGYFYSINELGKFLTWLKSSELSQNTIVVVTGDHVRKSFKSYASNREAFYKYSVPLYFYIPKKYQQLKHKIIPASHIDIFPTLFDLSLSRANYFSFGTSLLSANHQKYGFNIHNPNNIAIILENGVINNNHFFNFKPNDTMELDSKKIKLDQYKKDIVLNIKYKEALAKYFISKEFEKNKK